MEKTDNADGLSFLAMINTRQGIVTDLQRLMALPVDPFSGRRVKL
jgi:hypothetical protein